jgi:hypothetical protein
MILATVAKSCEQNARLNPASKSIQGCCPLGLYEYDLPVKIAIDICRMNEFGLGTFTRNVIPRAGAGYPTLRGFRKRD